MNFGFIYFQKKKNLLIIFSDTENIKFVDAAVRDTILNTLLGLHGLN